MQNLFTAPPKKICILRFSALGDVCQTVPVLRTLQHHWPDSEITWIIGKTEANLVGDIPNVRFIIFDKSRGVSAFADLRRQLGKQKFDLLLHLQEALRASIATLFIKAKIKLGFNRQDAQDHQWLFTNEQVEYLPRSHYMDRLLQFPKRLNLEPMITWDIPIPEADQKYIDQLFPTDEKLLVISPCSSVRRNNWRNWSIEKYAKISDLAWKKWGMQVVLTGGPSEMEQAYGKEICAMSNTPINNLIGQLNLKQLLALIKKSQAIISPDSGPAHMATTVGTPVIGLFATSNPEFTGPYNNKTWNVNRYPDAVQQYLGKSIDELPWGKRVRDPNAMDIITIDDVAKKLQQLDTLFNSDQHRQNQEHTTKPIYSTSPDTA